MIAPLFFRLSNSKIYIHSLMRSPLTLAEEKQGGCPIPEGKATFSHAGSSREWLPLVSGPACMLAREDVLPVLAEEGVTGYTAFPAEFASVQSTSLSAKPRPAYFWLRPEGRIGIDPTRLHETKDYGVHRAIPVRTQWTGGDFVTVANKNWRTIYCPRKILLLARKHRWKELNFCPMDMTPGMPSMYGTRSGIDYLGKKWPPEWYPPGMAGDPSNLEEIETLG